MCVLTQITLLILQSYLTWQRTQFYSKCGCAKKAAHDIVSMRIFVCVLARGCNFSGAIVGSVLREVWRRLANKRANMEHTD